VIMQVHIVDDADDAALEVNCWSHAGNPHILRPTCARLPPVEQRLASLLAAPGRRFGPVWQRLPRYAEAMGFSPSCRSAAKPYAERTMTPGACGVKCAAR
jgi:hypothetical protein